MVKRRPAQTKSSMTITGWPVGLEQHGHNRAEAARQDTELFLTATGTKASLIQSQSHTQKGNGAGGCGGKYGAMP